MIRIEMIDLFGERIVQEISESKSSRKPTQPKGFAWTPGTGPVGETCKTCEHAVGAGQTARTYYKCALMRHHWTAGPGTDIRLRSPACKYWGKEAPSDRC
jgi:hypothetical protein